MLYLCFGNAAGVEVCFGDFWDFLSESSHLLLRMVLGAKVGLVGRVSCIGEHFWIWKRIFLEFIGTHVSHAT